MLQAFNYQLTKEQSKCSNKDDKQYVSIHTSYKVISKNKGLENVFNEDVVISYKSIAKINRIENNLAQKHYEYCVLLKQPNYRN